MIRFNKNTIREALIALIILVPYLEESTVNSSLTIRIGEAAYLRPVNIFMGVVILVLVVVLFLSRRGILNKVTKRGMIVGSIIVLSVLSSLLQTENFTASLCTLIWFIEPFLYATLAALFCKKFSLDRNSVFKYMCYLFAFYCLLKVYGYISVYGYNSGYRMRATGGGAVIFGYTIVVMFALLITVRERVKPLLFYIILVVYTLTAVATGTRASIWPTIFLWFCVFFFDRWSAKKLVLLLAMVPALMVLMLIDIPGLISGGSANIARLVSFEDLSRINTASNSMRVFCRFPVLEMLFGKGLGNLFPYQYWSLLVQARIYNTFTYDGFQLLVQPHNSYIYMLLENGLVGLILMITIFVKIVKIIRLSNTNKYKQRILVVLAIVFVNFFDSIFFVQPGVAGNFWLILFALYDMAQEEKCKMRKCGL